jgi:hypothetical protein
LPRTTSAPPIHNTTLIEPNTSRMTTPVSTARQRMRVSAVRKASSVRSAKRLRSCGSCAKACTVRMP